MPSSSWLLVQMVGTEVGNLASGGNKPSGPWCKRCTGTSRGSVSGGCPSRSVLRLVVGPKERCGGPLSTWPEPTTAEQVTSRWRAAVGAVVGVVALSAGSNVSEIIRAAASSTSCRRRPQSPWSSLQSPSSASRALTGRPSRAARVVWATCWESSS